MTDDVTTHFHEAETPAMGVDRMPFWPVVAAGASGASARLDQLLLYWLWLRSWR